MRTFFSGKKSSVIFNLLVLSSLLVSCTFPRLPGSQTATPTPQSPTEAASPEPTSAIPKTAGQPLPPSLVETSPAPHSEIPLDSAVEFTFNQAMDRTSVEAALKTSPVVGGRFTWKDDRTLAFQPDQAYQPGQTVSFSLDTSARAANGLTLQDPLELSYRAVGSLLATQRLPENGAVDIDPSSAVSVSFNHSIVALGGDATSEPAAFTLEPAADGQGEWVNTSTYVFYPRPALAGGIQYTVHLNMDLAGQDGAQFDDAFRSTSGAGDWSFQTALPQVSQVEPSTETPLPLDASIKVTFNQPMDPAATQAAFSLEDAGGSPQPGAFSWDDQDTTLTFQPDQRLARGSIYTIRVSSAAQGQGGTPLASEFAAQVISMGDFALLSSQPADGQTLDSYGGYGSVSLNFSAPLGDQDLESLISASPEIANRSIYLDQQNQTLMVSGYFQPETTYSLSLAAGLADQWGESLPAPVSVHFQTPSMPPAVYLTSDQTGAGVAYLTPQDTALAAQAVNLTHLDLSLGSITWDDFLRLNGTNGFNERQGFSVYGAASWSQNLSTSRNVAQDVGINLNPSGGALEPGLYFMTIASPELAGQNTSGSMQVILVVSGVQVTLKVGSSNALVWAVNLADGSPAAGQAVRISDENGQTLVEGQTDDQGVFQSDIPSRADPYQPVYALIGTPGEAGFGMASSNWSQGLEGWSFGLSSVREVPHTKVYLYTDRPIYRPGDTLYFRGIVRQADNGRYATADALHQPIELYGVDQSGIAPVLLESYDLSLSDFGSVHAAYTLADDAPPGMYYLTVPDQPETTLYFQVADYRTPQIDLGVELSARDVLAGDPLQGSVKAHYYFGAPAGHLPLTWSFYRSSSVFSIPNAQVGTLDTDWMTFGISSNDLGGLVTQGSGETNADGTFSIDLPTTLEGIVTGSPLKYTLEVTLQDENNQPVSARAVTTVHPARFYAGVEPDHWTAQAGQAMGFSIHTVTWDGKPVEVQNLSAEFQQVRWVRNPQTNLFSTYTQQTTPVATADFSSDASGLARLEFTAPDPGTYQVEIRGGGALTQALVWVGGAGEADWPDLRNQQIRLTADRDTYQPGDQAQVFVPNPFPNAVTALVSVERGRILRWQIVQLESGGSQVPVTLSDGDAPNVYVSVTLLAVGGGNKPAFRQGITELKVDPRREALHLEVSGLPAQAAPGSPVDLTLHVSDDDGNPVRGEFSLAVVDKAVLALADPNSAPIMDAFYGEQPLGVLTGLSLAVYAGRQVEMAGGIGGGGDGMPLANSIRSNFQDTAYWNAEIVTDAAGEAQVSFNLPDNLTTWRFDLRGITADSKVGQATADLVSSQDLMILPDVPRFAVAGDHLELAASVHNQTAQDLDVSVGLQAEGFSLDDPAQAAQTIHVPAGDHTRVTWWGTVSAGQAGQGLDLRFTANAGSLSDGAEVSPEALPVLGYTASQAFATAGMLDGPGDRLEVVSLPNQGNVLGGSLKVNLQPSLAALVLDGIESGSVKSGPDAESILSALLPRLEAYAALQAAGVTPDETSARLLEQVKADLPRLMALQNMDGGWSWSRAGTSQVQLTAYTIFALEEAQKNDLPVSSDSLARAVAFLQTSPIEVGLSTPAWELDQLAFVQFALQQAGSGDPQTTGALYEVRDQLDPAARAWLALTLEGLSSGDERARTLINDLESQAVRFGSGVNWPAGDAAAMTWSSGVQTSAVVVYALAQRDPATALLPDAVHYLVQNRAQAGQWTSSYEEAWVYLALTQVLRSTGELQAQYDFSAQLNQAPIASGQAGGAASLNGVTVEIPIQDLDPQGPNGLLIQHGDGAGKLYYAATLQAVLPAENAAPLQRGIQVEREYTLSGQDCVQTGCPAIQQASLGDGAVTTPVQARVTITLSQDAAFLKIEDWIPGGMEILNPELNTSASGEPVQPSYDPRDPYGEQSWGWWLFGSPAIYKDHLMWTAENVPAGSYTLTYTLIPHQVGEFRVLPAQAWESFFPEVQGSSAGTVFTITP